MYRVFSLWGGMFIYQRRLQELERHELWTAKENDPDLISSTNAVSENYGSTLDNSRFIPTVEPSSEASSHFSHDLQHSARCLHRQDKCAANPETKE